MQKSLNRLVKEESGSAAIEYALLTALIAVMIVGSVTLLAAHVNAVFTQVASTLK